ncbi:GNAT family N-acetyltransferase [Actinospica robiniae]|uniref:GNAT family N-acetyltransferase n=1 Tax=Actinospica robiniae TaxID=304901 RepID=UPI0003F87C96|nr:GNAT family N-acetyltransferase [Actinospica robiniae]
MTTTNVPLGLAEQTEIKAYTDFVAGAPASVREALGIGSVEIGSARAIAVRGDSTGFFNRAGGFSPEYPIDADVVARTIDFYREKQLSSGAFMVAPPVLPTDWTSIAAKYDLVEGTRYVKLACDVESAVATTDVLGPLDPKLHIGLVESRQAREWASAMMPALGFAPELIDVAEACVGRPGWRQFAAWEGERIVGVGSIFVNGECANMMGGATLEGWRGRGVQTALLAARIRAAHAAGCRWMVAEAFAEAPGQHNSSLHNMLRSGFERLYDRVAWVWNA